MEGVSTYLDFDGAITGWFNEIGFPSDGVTQQQIDNTYQFVFMAGQDFHPEFSIPKQFFENPTVLAAAELACRLHQEDKRIVSGDPYFKHALKTACLCAQLVRAEDFKQGDSNQYYWEIMEAAAFLHDVIEIRRDSYNMDQLTDDLMLRLCSALTLSLPKGLIEVGVEEGQAKRIAYLVGKLTPPPKEEGTGFAQRRLEKQADFSRIMEETCADWEGSDKETMAKILGLLKVNDVLAVLEERVADLSLERTNGLFAGKPVEYVVGVVSDRIEYLKTHKDSVPDDVTNRLRFYFAQLNQLLISE